MAKRIFSVACAVIFAVVIITGEGFASGESLRIKLGFSEDKSGESRTRFTRTFRELDDERPAPLERYGLSLNSVKFTQLSGPEEKNDPAYDDLLMRSITASNMTALSAYFNRACGIDRATGDERPDAKARKKIADGGAVTVMENMLNSMARELDIAIIIGGSEGKTRDGAPALRVKQVINPRGRNGMYIVHADPVENTNAQAEDKEGAWVLFFLTKIPFAAEEKLRKTSAKAGLSVEDLLEKSHGQEVARYKMLFCHDRYVIAVSYPGSTDHGYRAKIDPAGDPAIILNEIAKEHGIMLEELGKKTHIVFLKGERTRHDYIENALEELREQGNEITYGTVDDGDAFARIIAMAGLPSKSGKEWTIIIGASGGVEGFATGLTASGRKNKQGTTVGRVSMVHSSRNISGSDLSGWDNYSEGDLRDFSALGITQPNNILTEGDFSGYERIFVATSITGARRDIDISSDIPVNKVSVERGRIKLNSFIIDGRGRGFIVESEYDMPDHVHTEIMLRADNDYGLIDDDNSIRDYAIRRLIKSDVDAETFMWEEKLGVIGLSEETLDWLEALLVAKERGSATVPLSDSMLLLRKKNIPVDTAIDMALKGDCELKISNDFLLIVDKRNLEADSVENIKNAGARQDI